MASDLALVIAWLTCTACSACRFDVLCVVRDLVDPVQDKRLAQFVVSSHAASHPDLAAGPAADDGILPPAAGAAAGPEPDGELLSQEMLRKYITYAKQHCRPQINQVRQGQVQCGSLLSAPAAVQVQLMSYLQKLASDRAPHLYVKDYPAIAICKLD